MKACMVAYTFYETDNRVRRYAETLVRRGDRVDAIVLRRPGQSSFEVIQGVNVYRVQERVIDEGRPFDFLVKLLAFLARSAWMLTYRHLRQRYDLIHVHSVPDFEVFSTIVPKLLGAKVILDIHDIVPELYASKFKIAAGSFPFRMLVAMEKLSTRYADHVIIANHLWYERLTARSCPPEHCTAILNYPDPRIFRNSAREVDAVRQKFLLCYPGTLSHHQGVDLIVSAMAVLRDQIPGLKLAIFGDGPERERLNDLVKSHNLGEQVSIGAGVSLEKVAETMQRVSLGVEPKRKRSFGNEALSTKILEFMAMGVPVLASDTAINRRYFDGGLVEFFESEDVDGLAGAILRLANDPSERARLVTRGREFVKQNNWDVKSHEYLDLVDELVGGGTKRELSLIPESGASV